MADAAEEAIVTSTQIEDQDAEEEIQDFRFLLTAAQSTKLPSRGTKDSEPNGTNLQQATLDASREAMHLALSHIRKHTSDKSRAVYDEIGNGAWVFRPSGVWGKSTGKERVVPGRVTQVRDSNGNMKDEKLKRMWLLPEEALWLVERGSLDLRYPSGDGEEEDEGLPMSLQAAYAKFIGGESGLSLEEFGVYQYLKRCGYIVFRANDNLRNIPEDVYPTMLQESSLSPTSILWRWFFSAAALKPDDKTRIGTLVKPGLYRNYDDIYRQLSLIPFHDPQLPPQTSESQLSITWHVYKPVPAFKKTAPGPPDFYICVVSAQDTSLLAEVELDALLGQTPFHKPDQKAGLNTKLKTGWRNVVLAVVDQGVTSYVDFSDAGFGCERLWEKRKGRPLAGKKGRNIKGNDKK